MRKKVGAGTKSRITVKLAAATESCAGVEDDASFGTHGKRHEVQCGVP